MFSSKTSESFVRLNPKESLLVQANFHEWGFARDTTELPASVYKRLVEQRYFETPMSELFSSSGTSNTSSTMSAALVNVYTTAVSTRQQLIRRIDEIRDFYLVDVIINQFCDDSLNPDISTGDILRLNSKNPKIKSELDFLSEEFNLDSLVKSILPEILFHGEYTLSTITKKSMGGIASAPENLTETKKYEESEELSGLLELNDNVDQSEVLAITKNNRVSYYLSSASGDSGDQNLEKLHKSNYVQFSLDSQRVRLDLHREFNHLAPKERKEIERLPRFIRVGKSTLLPLVDKIHELNLLEKLVPAAKLSKLSSGTIIGLNVPPGYDTKKAREAAKSVESIINNQVVVNEEDRRAQISEILASVGRVKVVPIMDGKGETNVLETHSDEPDNLTADIEILRRTITDSMGVPFELIFSSDGDRKSDILKRYSRYLRKLKAIQSAVISGITQIIKIHLGAKGIPFEDDDIKVDFANKLVELENLDKLEFVDGSVSLLENLKDFVESLIDSDFSEIVDKKEFSKYLKDQFRLIGLDNLISEKGIRSLNKTPEPSVKKED